VHHRLNGREHVLLRDEAHLHVQLVEIQGTVGAQVLASETWAIWK